MLSVSVIGEPVVSVNHVKSYFASPLLFTSCNFPSFNFSDHGFSSLGSLVLLLSPPTLSVSLSLP